MGFNKRGGRGGGGGSGKFDRQLAQINSRIQKAFVQISQITDNAVAEFTSDVAKMTAQLIRDDTKKTKNSRSTGKLANSVRPSKRGAMMYSVETTATNRAGYGYGAPQEWGWKNPRSKKTKRTKESGGWKTRKAKMRGKHSIVRATFGMVKRWQRGERWRD
jgi:hypothetical protein